MPIFFCDISIPLARASGYLLSVKHLQICFFQHCRVKYLRLHSCGREGSCCWFSGCHSPPPLINRLVRNPESGRPAPILPGTVSRRAVGSAGGLSWLQISGVINTITIKYLWRRRCTGQILSTPQGASSSPPSATQWRCRFQKWV